MKKPSGRNTNVASIYTTLLGWMALFLPFQMLGVFVGDYLFSVSVVVAILFLAAHVLFGKLDYRILMLTIVFIFWCALTSVFRHPPNTYLLSLLVVGLMISQLAHRRLIEIDRDSVFRYLAFGFWLSFGLSFTELFLLQIAPALQETLSSGIFEESRTGNFYGYNRAKGFMREPSFLAIYFTMVYVIVDLRSKIERQATIMKAASVVGVVFTMSLSGIVILLSYLVVKGFKNLMQKGLPSKIRISTIKAGVVVLIFGAVSFFFNWDFFSSFSLLISQRLELSLELYGQDGVSGSVGSRVNVFLPMIRYWTSTGFWGTITGVGYGNYDTYLLNEYSAFDILLSFARGQMSSILAVIGLSVGLVGLLLFLVLFLLICFSAQAVVGLPVAVFFVFIMLAYGGLVDYFFWQGLLLIRIFSNEMR